MHAPVIASLLIALVFGALAQRSRICMVGGMRDAIMFRDFNLLIGFGCIFVVVLLGNIILGNFSGFSFSGQPIAHSDHLYNLLGMTLVGWGSTLLGGCPLRQLILAGEGNGDSAVTVLGMVVGAAISHNFGLAGAAANADSAGGVKPAGRIAIYIGLGVLLCVSVLNTFIKKKEAAK
jgi:YedE family putative selenium metabolism protein